MPFEARSRNAFCRCGTFCRCSVVPRGRKGKKGNVQFLNLILTAGLDFSLSLFRVAKAQSERNVYPFK